MTDLSLIQFDDLMEELRSRFDCYHFVGVKEITKKTYEYISRYRGDNHTVLGLLHRSQRKLDRHLDETEKNID